MLDDVDASVGSGHGYGYPHTSSALAKDTAAIEGWWIDGVGFQCVLILLFGDLFSIYELDTAFDCHHCDCLPFKI